VVRKHLQASEGGAAAPCDPPAKRTKGTGRTKVDFVLWTIYSRYCNPSTSLLSWAQLNRLLEAHQLDTTAGRADGKGRNSSNKESRQQLRQPPAEMFASLGGVPSAAAARPAAIADELFTSVAAYSQDYQVCTRCENVRRQQHLDSLEQAVAGGAGACGKAPRESKRSVQRRAQQLAPADDRLSPPSTTAPLAMQLAAAAAAMAATAATAATVVTATAAAAATAATTAAAIAAVTEPTSFAVVVRRIPNWFEGEKLNACDHFQWTWCPGIPGNQKCSHGAASKSRHSSCPKYLAASTVWKHRTEPKT
jgi:hypothetical protein